MTRDEYVQYSECRQASFTFKKGKKFREWCGLTQLVDTRPSDDLIDILGFLATETVRTLVEAALCVRDEWLCSGVAVASAGPESAGGMPVAEPAGLFSRATTSTVVPIQARHVAEAYRRVQQGEEFVPRMGASGKCFWRPRARATAMSVFRGGLIRGRTSII